LLKFLLDWRNLRLDGLQVLLESGEFDVELLTVEPQGLDVKRECPRRARILVTVSDCIRLALPARGGGPSEAV